MYQFVRADRHFAWHWFPLPMPLLTISLRLSLTCMPDPNQTLLRNTTTFADDYHVGSHLIAFQYYLLYIVINKYISLFIQFQIDLLYKEKLWADIFFNNVSKMNESILFVPIGFFLSFFHWLRDNFHFTLYGLLDQL